MVNLKLLYTGLINQVSTEAPFKPEISIILGSGLGNFASQLEIVKTIPTVELKDYPASTVQGHAGKLIFATYNGRRLMLFQGRIHFYEGYKIHECILPVYLSHLLDCKKMLFTNAAGAINTEFAPGDLMINSSFNAISLKKELTDLIGITSKEIKDSFIDFPSAGFMQTIRAAAAIENIMLKEGVYWYSKGPSYETPAEIRMMRAFGGDAVGMSTVHEAVFAGYLGMQTAAISCITNYAPGIINQKLTHDEVTETANRVEKTFADLLKKIIELS